VPAEPPRSISAANPVFEDSELVFGLVAPVGTNFEVFQNLLDRGLKKFGYAINVVRLSDLTANVSAEGVPPLTVTGSREYKRLNTLMHAGNALRLASGRGEFLALAAAKEISDNRSTTTPVRLRTAHVLRSLKHPDEVRALRRIYGSGFYLIGVTVDEGERREYLKDEKACTDEELAKLLRRDEHEEDAAYFGQDGTNFGQRTRDTFHLADVFVPLKAEDQLERFLSLIFGAPFITPTLDEYAVFLAFGASLRSGDLSRQVGAVVVSAAGDVVGVGANDVPCAGGGLYWPGPADRRDHVLQQDSNEVRRDAIVTDVLERLLPAEAKRDEWLVAGKRKLKGSPLMDITEYGRAVHAEMESLMSCGRSGISPSGGTLYSTTFPCHNCAKHIIAAGVKRVVYVEPYPKSQAKDLFDDSIVLGRDGGDPKKVRFEPFVGVGPRKFIDLFSMGLSSGTQVKRKSDGRAAEWRPEAGIVRVPMMPNSYLEREKAAANEVEDLTKSPEDAS
jgi:deoxycytidylate deaminase